MTGVAWLLIGGFVAFMIGAVAWRIDYERPDEESLPLLFADRRRLRWIHRWMLLAMVLTTSGIGGLAWRILDPGAAVAAAVYTLGAALWMMTLLFRLTVGEWAAERTVSSGSVPEVYPPFARLFGLGHAVHMLTAFGSAVPLLWSTYDTGLIPLALAWSGTGWAVLMSILFLVPKTRFVASPPFWAHTATLAVGIALLA
jgi:hypothetical protein